MAEWRVLVVDDEQIVREAYRAFLTRTPDFELCGEASDGDQALDRYEELAPDLVLMDLQMARVGGVEAITEICTAHPEAVVVALTTFGSHDWIAAALRAGAAGYLLKDVTGAELHAGLRQALAGEMPLSAAVRRELARGLVAAAPDPVRLTRRERQLVAHLGDGLTNRQIGARMHVSEGSVKQYLSHVGDKLGARTRTQILVRAIQLGLVDPGGPH